MRLDHEWVELAKRLILNSIDRGDDVTVKIKSGGYETTISL
ncbi:MAG: hypothetical protein V2A73_21400 [Pseudomonadota bacterium]